MAFRHGRVITALLLLPLLILSACTREIIDPAPQQGPFLRGTALVVAVEPTLGRATLEYQGQRVQAYWQTETASPQGGSVVRMDALQSPVGQYREAQVRTQVFAAKQGDTIEFMGMRTGDSIFLQSIVVMAK